MKDVDSSKPGEKMKKILILSVLLLSPTLFAKIIEKEIKIGKITTIKLPSNPTTGYVWSYTVTPIDEDLVKIDKKDFCFLYFPLTFFSSLHWVF